MKASPGSVESSLIELEGRSQKAKNVIAIDVVTYGPSSAVVNNDVDA
jgi:hypothetical protein